MSTIQDNDLFEVQRGTDSYKQSAVDLMSTIQDTDYMLIQRGTASYKVTCEDVKDQLGGGGGVTAPVLDSVVLSQDGSPDANRFTSKSFTSTTTNSGGDATTLEMTGTVTGALGINAGSDPITTNAYPGTSSTSVVLTLEGEANLGDVIQQGDTVTANVSYTPETDTISSVAARSEIVGWTLSDMNENAGVYYKNTSSDWSTTLSFSGGTPGQSYIRFVVSYVSITSCVISGSALDAPISIDFSGVSNPADGAAVTFYPNVAAGDLTVSCTGSSGQSNIVQVINSTSIEDYGATYAALAPSQAGNVLTLPSEKDIALFQVDDIVQGTDADAVVTTDNPAGFRSDRPQANIIDGNKTTRCDLDSANVGDFQYGIFVDIEALLGSNYMGQLSIYTDYNTSSDDGTRYQFYVVYADNTESSKVGFNSGGGWKTVVSNGSKAIKSIVATAVDGRTPGLWTAIGTSSSDSGIISGDAAVKVTATDVSAKTITVDGGTWDTSNQSQVWSDSVSNATNSAAAFNGDLTDGADAAVDVYGEIDASGWGFADATVEVYLFQNGEVLVNDNPVTLTGASSLGWASIDVTGDLQSIKWKHPSQTYTLRAVKVGSRILVDKANESQTWSNSTLTYSGDAGPGNTTTISNVFDGDTSTGFYVVGTFGSPSIVYRITFAQPVRGSKVRVFTGGDADAGAAVNATSSDDLVAAASYSWTTIYDDVEIDINSIALGAVSGTGDNVTTAIEIDGQLLVDPGARYFGDTKVSTTSAKQGSGTVSDITGAQVTVSPFTDNCFKEGQYLTVNKTINVNPKTDKITSYDDSTKVITVDGDTDLMQFADGDAVFMTDNSGSGASTKTGYKLTTTDIESVGPAQSDGNWSNGYIASAATNNDCSNPESTLCPKNFFNSAKTNGYQLGRSNAVGVDTQYTIEYVNTFPAGSYALAWDFGREGTADLRDFSVYVDGVQQVIKSGNFGVNVDSGTYNWTQSAPFTRLKFECFGASAGNAGVAIQTLSVGGTRLVDGTPVDIGTLLTFPGAASTNPDLGYFKPNDIVGSTGVSFTYTGATAPTVTGDPFSTPTNDGGANSVRVNTPSTVTSITYTFPTAININAVANQIGGGSYSLGVDFTLTWIDQNGTEFTSSAVSTPAGYSYQSFPVAAPALVKAFRITGDDGSAFTGFYQSGTGVNVGNLGVDVKVVSVDTTDNKMTVDGGTWAEGDKVEYQTTGGVGTIAAGGVNATNKTITLTAAESGAARWIADNKAGTEFRVATATKPAVATTAYLKFSADGSVTGYQATPVDPRAMDNKSNPKLTFPATFSDTGQAPDTEFPGTQTYIQTSVQLKNSAGNSATVKSNSLVPQTNIRSVVAACQCESNADDVRAMGMQIATHDQRVADHTAAMRQQAIADFEANLRRYSS